MKGTERGGTTRAHLVATVLYAQETFQQENGRTELGEELLNPQVESILFELKAFVNHDLCKSDAGFLVMDNFFTGRKANVEHWLHHPNFSLVRHDVIQPILLEVDQIYHLACPASPPHYQYNPVKTIKVSWCKMYI